ncbi:uncharacterized protein LOC132698214 [Cylas formicarius]|uniref:uncharacterized protein LOC132698214 n=1 Tax=Cylas formicarius TaxID=197179 RepID=UPI0029584CEE|nr:uncharacterized protein LOC132698214 [Cylas formicarius]
MISAKVFLSLCVCAIIVHAKPQVSYYPDNATDGIFDPVKVALETLTDLVRNAVNEALLTFENLIRDILNVAQQISNDAFSQVTKIGGGFIEQIDKLVAEATGLGVDISDCVDEAVNQINALENRVSSTIGACINIEVDTALRFLNDSVNEVNATLGQVEDLVVDLANCVDVFILEIPVCVAGVSAKVVVATAELPLRVANIVASAVSTVQTFATTLGSCTTGTISSMTQQGADIVNDVTTCANNKMHNAAHIK